MPRGVAIVRPAVRRRRRNDFRNSSGLRPRTERVLEMKNVLLEEQAEILLRTTGNPLENMIRALMGVHSDHLENISECGCPWGPQGVTTVMLKDRSGILVLIR